MTAALTNVVGSRSMFWTRRRERSLPKFSSWRLPNLVPPWWHSYWLSYCLLAVVLVWVSIFFRVASFSNCTTFFILDPLSQQFLTCFFNFFLQGDDCSGFLEEAGCYFVSEEAVTGAATAVELCAAQRREFLNLTGETIPKTLLAKLSEKGNSWRKSAHREPVKRPVWKVIPSKEFRHRFMKPSLNRPVASYTLSKRNVLQIFFSHRPTDINASFARSGNTTTSPDDLCSASPLR